MASHVPIKGGSKLNSWQEISRKQWTREPELQLWDHQSLCFPGWGGELLQGPHSPLEAHYWKRKRWFTSVCSTLESSDCISVSLICPVDESSMFDKILWVAGVARDLRKHGAGGHWHPLLRTSFVHSKKTAWFVLRSIAGFQTKPIPMYLSASFNVLESHAEQGESFHCSLCCILVVFPWALS